MATLIDAIDSFYEVKTRPTNQVPKSVTATSYSTPGVGC